VELLERESALAALTEAREAAARGNGRVVFVTGEPGIGKLEEALASGAGRRATYLT
jgi:predicted ATPase